MMKLICDLKKGQTINQKKSKVKCIKLINYQFDDKNFNVDKDIDN